MTSHIDPTTGAQALLGFARALLGGGIRVVDLTQTLTPEFPQIALPPEFGQCWPFRIEEVSKYDERGPGWYWNNFSCGVSVSSSPSPPCSRQTSRADRH